MDGVRRRNELPVTSLLARTTTRVPVVPVNNYQFTLLAHITNKSCKTKEVQVDSFKEDEVAAISI
jgi:hypothetical protein